MVNYRKDRKRFAPNGLGSLYINQNALESIGKAKIYIGGQLEHRLHRIEQCGYTFDIGHSMFDGSWFYDYPINTNDNSVYNAENFAQNLLASIEMSGLEEVDIVTESFGGLIASYASKSDLVGNIVAIHPPILGTPLADITKYAKYYNRLNLNEKILYGIVKKLIDSSYGFEQNNFGLIDYDKMDLDKILVVGSSVVPEKEDYLVKSLYSLIMDLTGYRSDGVVVFEKELFDRIGIKFILDEQPTNHFDAGSKKHIEKTLALVK